MCLDFTIHFSPNAPQAEGTVTYQTLLINTFKVTKKQRYRFSLLVNELRSNDLPTYLTSVMAFINCVIIANDDLDERVRIRDELIGKLFPRI